VGYSEEAINAQYHYILKLELWATQQNVIEANATNLKWQMRVNFADYHLKVNGENWGVTHQTYLENTAFTIKNVLELVVPTNALVNGQIIVG